MHLSLPDRPHCHREWSVDWAIAQTILNGLAEVYPML